MLFLQKILDADWFEEREEIVDRLGMPRCNRCGGSLHIGDTVDVAWPWFDDFNLCRICLATGGTGGAQG